MHKLKRNIKKELDEIAEKGLSSGNLESTSKLIDMYKDIVEICEKEEGEMDMYGTRGRMGRSSYDDWDEYGARGGSRGGGRGGRGGNYGNMDDRYERHLNRMRDGLEEYYMGRNRYMDGGSQERMIEGVEMTMAAIVSFVEAMVDFAETKEEKEIVRKYVDKLKKI